MKPGIIVEDRAPTVYNDGADLNQDIWFDFKHDNGSTSILNGQRICTIEFAKSRGFKDAE